MTKKSRFIPISLSMSKDVYYRGIVGKYDPNKFGDIIWVTKDWDYAKLYAESEENIHSFHISRKNSFDFGFRTLQVHVKISDIVERVKRGVMDAFVAKSIRKERAMLLSDKLADIEDSYPKSMLKAWEWIQKSQKDIIPILKELGYDSIATREGQGNDITAYGLFNKKQITKI